MKTFKANSWFWDSYAHCYDGLLGTVPYQRLLRRAIDCVPVGAGTLLDAGCGTGNLLASVRRRRRDIDLHGIDFSEAMLRRARAKLSEAQFLPGDLNAALPYPDGSFDVVTCINVLYAVARPERTLAELRRVLKPGGTLILSSPSARPRMGAFIREHAAAVVGWVRTLPLLLRLALLVAFNVVIFRRGDAGQYHFLDKQAVQKLLACNPVTEAYASQNWFACTIKELTHEATAKPRSSRGNEAQIPNRSERPNVGCYPFETASHLTQLTT